MYTYRVCHASFCSIINKLLLAHCIMVIKISEVDKAVFLLSFVICVYDKVYQIFNKKAICSLPVVKV